MAVRTIPIRDALYERLSTIATRQGRKVEEVADDLLTETLDKGNGSGSRGKTFAEIFSPLEEDFAASGMTDDELGDFIGAEVKAHRIDQQQRSNVH